MAQVDYFLDIDGIQGESHDSQKKNQIELVQWSWSAEQTGSSSYGSGGGAGRVHMHDFHFVMKSNKASPKLMLACATGKHIAKATLTCRKAGGGQKDFLKYTFEKLLISSYQTGGQGSSDVIPLDSISFNFAKISIEYKAQKDDGSLDAPVTASYDLKTNESK
jgi:type VI secretion system secreted protein Hcp